MTSSSMKLYYLLFVLTAPSNFQLLGPCLCCMCHYKPLYVGYCSLKTDPFILHKFPAQEGDRPATMKLPSSI